MRCLVTHVDFIEYEPVHKEVSNAEDVEKKVYRLEQLLVIFTAVEEKDNEEKLKKMVSEVLKTVEHLGVRKILIYPFAHLSNQLARPSRALELIKQFEGMLKEKGLEVSRAPFGWSKGLHIKVKSHPFAEQLKVV